MAYHSKFTGKEVDDILDSVSGKQDKLSETNQVQKGQIADRAVEGKNVAINAITTSKIAPLAVTNPRIADEAVSYEKLSSAMQNRVVETFNFSTEDIADWSGTDAHFKTTFGYALSVIINRAGTRTVRVNFTYQSTRYDALACCTTPTATVQSVSFLIHNSDGLTELISMNLDGSNVTVTNETLGGGSEMTNGIYLAPAPKMEDVAEGEEIKNYTKTVCDLLDSAWSSDKIVVCDMSEYTVEYSLGRIVITEKEADGSLDFYVNTLSSLPQDNGVITFEAIMFNARYDGKTEKTTVTFVNSNNAVIGPTLLPVVLDSGRESGFYNLTSNPYTFPSATSFKMQFGFAFDDLMQAAEKPLLLKTKGTDGNKVVMHAVSCMDNGDTMRIDFLNGDILYYCRSTDGGQTVSVGHNVFVTSLG